MSENREKTSTERAAAAAELWELVRLAEEAGMMKEPMELRRFFAEHDHRLDAASLRALAGLARNADLSAAAQWCNEEVLRSATAPRFIERLRGLFEPKSEIVRQVAEEKGLPVIDLPLAETSDDDFDPRPGRGR